MGITKGGIPYLSLKLMDRTGEINARVWEEAVHYDQIFGKDDFINVSGVHQSTKGGCRSPLPIKKCPRETLICRTSCRCAFSIEEMLEELQLIMEDIKDKYLRNSPNVFCGKRNLSGFYDRSSGQGASPCLSGRLNGAFTSMARLARMFRITMTMLIGIFY